MAVFVDIVFSAPTVVFTVGLVISLAYWAMVILGAVDIELFDAADGMLDGAMDALEGSLDVADGAIEGAADGAVDGATEGVTDGASSGVSPLLFLANVLRMGRVPLTVSLSAFVLWGWLAAFVLTWLYLWIAAPLPFVAFVIASLLLTTLFATVLTNVSVRPLEPVFKASHGRERKSLIGEQCVITTGRVDDRFGQATTMVESDDLLFQVRCDASNPLKRGDAALIVHWDDTREAFIIEPLAPALVESAQPAAPTQPLSPITEV